MDDYNEQSIFDHRINQIMIVNVLWNWNHIYFSDNSDIKCVGFELIYYTTNLNVVSSFIVFSDFDYMFLSLIMLI